MRISLLFLSALLLATSSPILAAVIEIPPPNSIQSGVSGFIGWKCDAGIITVRFDGGEPLEVPYGVERNDTSTTCGDAHNGFSISLNYNILGEGSHMAEVFDNDELFASVEFTVVTLGEEFLKGVMGSGIIEMSDGQLVAVEWSEEKQGFAIQASYPSLKPLLGDWLFSYTLEEPLRELYRLRQIDLTKALPIVSGSVAAQEVHVQPWRETPRFLAAIPVARQYSPALPNQLSTLSKSAPSIDLDIFQEFDFALIDANCKLFVFNFEDSNTLEGLFFLQSSSGFAIGLDEPISCVFTAANPIPFSASRTIVSLS